MLCLCCCSRSRFAAKPRHDANVVNEGSRGGGSQPSIRGSGVINERAKDEIQARDLWMGQMSSRTPIPPLSRLQIPTGWKKGGFLPSVFVLGPYQEMAKRVKVIFRTLFFCCCFKSISNVAVTIKYDVKISRVLNGLDSGKLLLEWENAEMDGARPPPSRGPRLPGAGRGGGVASWRHRISGPSRCFCVRGSREKPPGILYLALPCLGTQAPRPPPFWELCRAALRRGLASRKRIWDSLRGAQRGHQQTGETPSSAREAGPVGDFRNPAVHHEVPV